MGKLNYTHEDDNIQSVNNQWIITSNYPDYKKFEKLFEQDGNDISENTTTANGEQIDLESEKTTSKWDDLKKDYLDWVLSKVQSFTLPINKLKVIRAWTITYNKNGYQGIHVHTGDMNYKTFSVVLHMDDVITTKENKYDGVLFTLMPEPNGYQHPGHYLSQAGGVVMLDGRVWHGVYPTSTQRRSFIVDFEYE